MVLKTIKDSTKTGKRKEILHFKCQQKARANLISKLNLSLLLVPYGCMMSNESIWLLLSCKAFFPEPSSCSRGSHLIPSQQVTHSNAPPAGINVGSESKKKSVPWCRGNPAEICQLWQLKKWETRRNTVCMSHRNRGRRSQKAGSVGTATTSSPSHSSQGL